MRSLLTSSKKPSGPGKTKPPETHGDDPHKMRHDAQFVFGP